MWYVDTDILHGVGSIFTAHEWWSTDIGHYMKCKFVSWREGKGEGTGEERQRGRVARGR